MNLLRAVSAYQMEGKVFNIKLIPGFNVSDTGQSVIEHIEKVELMFDLYAMRRADRVFPWASFYACAFVAELPTYLKQLLCVSSRMEAMTLDQIVARARAIMKDDISAAEPVAAAAQLPYKVIEQRMRRKITCFRCDGQNQLLSGCLSQRRWASSYRGRRKLENCDALGAIN